MNKFHACPQCRKVYQFKVSKCTCGYGEESNPKPSAEVEAAAAELLKEEPSEPIATGVPDGLFD